MKSTNKFWRPIPALVIGLLMIHKLIRSADDELIFDDFILLGLLIIFLIVLMWTNLKDIQEYKQTKSKFSFVPSATGLFIILSLIGTNYFLTLRDSSPLLIQAGYDGGFNGAWFEFRKDGTYKFVNSGGIGATYFRGAYTIEDSIISLDKSNFNNVIETQILAIRNAPDYDPTSNLILYQINYKHEIVDKEFAFTINVDNRNK